VVFFIIPTLFCGVFVFNVRIMKNIRTQNKNKKKNTKTKEKNKEKHNTM
jgi:uncharacterized membrane protein YciS (DUF1049 family)